MDASNVAKQRDFKSAEFIKEQADENG